MPNFERDEVVDEPMEAPFYPATSCFHKRNRILRVIFIRMSAEPQVIAPFGTLGSGKGSGVGQLAHGGVLVSAGEWWPTAQPLRCRGWIVA
uniref:hypothetical protein n=1 Tax=Xanthomonas euvesicatoria TaxID=456327 RepID=UPI003314075E